jgi:exonuclease VII small subunit
MVMHVTAMEPSSAGDGLTEAWMSQPASLESALARLDQAVAILESAVERRRSADEFIEGLEIEIARLGEDRSRLAVDLDGAVARAGRLEDANREVSRRLVAAMESIRTVLESHGG